jgi:hypothetical protein
MKNVIKVGARRSCAAPIQHTKMWLTEREELRRIAPFAASVNPIIAFSRLQFNCCERIFMQIITRKLETSHEPKG